MEGYTGEVLDNSLEGEARKLLTLLREKPTAWEDSARIAALTDQLTQADFAGSRLTASGAEVVSGEAVAERQAMAEEAVKNTKLLLEAFVDYIERNATLPESSKELCPVDHGEERALRGMRIACEATDETVTTEELPSDDMDSITLLQKLTGIRFQTTFPKIHAFLDSAPTESFMYGADTRTGRYSSTSAKVDPETEDERVAAQQELIRQQRSTWDRDNRT